MVDGHRTHWCRHGRASGMVGPLSTILMGIWILGEPFTPNGWRRARPWSCSVSSCSPARQGGRTLNAWGRALLGLAVACAPAVGAIACSAPPPGVAVVARRVGGRAGGAGGCWCWRACAGRAMPEPPPCACWVQHAWRAFAVHRRCCCLPHRHLRVVGPCGSLGCFSIPQPVCRPWWWVWWCWCRRARAHRPGAHAAGAGIVVCRGGCRVGRAHVEVVHPAGGALGHLHLDPGAIALQKSGSPGVGRNLPRARCVVCGRFAQFG